MATILVIDDDAAVRRVLVRSLAGAGHEIVEAEDGSSGLARFRECAPTLVITDIVMPQTEGIETIREIRRAAPQVKILAISGSSIAGSAHYLDMARKLGADVTLVKPIRPAELRDAVAALIGGASPP
ncbi:MAG: response regulator [Stellaceae bacterium]